MSWLAALSAQQQAVPTAHLLDQPGYFDDYGSMKTTTAVRSLAALAQESRLLVFRLLVQKGPQGMHPSDISARLKLSPATLSFHLKALAHAGLIRAQAEGRHIRYSADFKSMNTLLDYLTENCCQGRSCEVLPATRAVA
jgi:DNA-binding transcriptional ArsR family regulator